MVHVRCWPWPCCERSVTLCPWKQRKEITANAESVENVAAAAAAADHTQMCGVMFSLCNLCICAPSPAPREHAVYASHTRWKHYAPGASMVLKRKRTGQRYSLSLICLSLFYLWPWHTSVHKPDEEADYLLCLEKKRRRKTIIKKMCQFSPTRLLRLVEVRLSHRDFPMLSDCGPWCRVTRFTWAEQISSSYSQ